MTKSRLYSTLMILKPIPRWSFVLQSKCIRLELLEMYESLIDILGLHFYLFGSFARHSALFHSLLDDMDFWCSVGDCEDILEQLFEMFKMWSLHYICFSIKTSHKCRIERLSRPSYPIRQNISPSWKGKALYWCWSLLKSGSCSTKYLRF